MGKKIPDYDNPEHVTTGILEFNDETCTRCGTCASICPGRAIIVPPKKEGEKRGLPSLVEIAPGVTLCMGCGDCSAACPNKAIKVIRGFAVKSPYFYARLTQTDNFTFPKKY